MQLTQKELNTILEKHLQYLDSRTGGEQANLISANLSRVNLSNNNLIRANLGFTNLSGADLSCANLYLANLKCANLKGAKLSNANLYSANLKGANLEGAELNGANLYDCDLSYSDLRGADLSGAHLIGSNLHKAKLDKKEKFRRGFIAKEHLIGCKQLRNKVIATLEIPVGATIFCIDGKNYRTNKAKVVSLSDGRLGRSWFDGRCIYAVGKNFEIVDFDGRYNIDFTNGIHFFKTIEEAKRF